MKELTARIEFYRGQMLPAQNRAADPAGTAAANACGTWVPWKNPDFGAKHTAVRCPNVSHSRFNLICQDRFRTAAAGDLTGKRPLAFRRRGVPAGVV